MSLPRVPKWLGIAAVSVVAVANTELILVRLGTPLDVGGWRVLVAG